MRNGITLAAKFAALSSVALVLLGMTMVAGIATQAALGYYRFDIPLYLEALFGIHFVDYLLVAALAMTVHVIVLSGGAGSGASGGAVQTEVGLALTKLSGGRYENITTVTRLATLLPEFGKRIAESQAKQSHQFRVTYERPTAKPGTQVGTSIARPGSVTLTIDGHMP